jgi:hypothetical protein
MIVNVKRVATLLFVGMFFVAACQTDSLAASKGSPEWAGKSWSEGGYHYFSGISGYRDSVSGAREQAYMDALSKAAQYIGVSVADMTSYNVNTDASSLNSSTVLSSRDVQLQEGVIKEFEYTKENKGVVGYVLVQYNETALNKEKQRHEDIQKKEQARVAARSSAPIFIEDNSGLSALAAAVKNVFSKMGYKVSDGDDDGVPVELSLIDVDYQKTREGLVMCVIKAEVKLKNKLQVFEAFSYGKDDEAALDRAKQRVADIFGEEVDRNIF